MLRPHLACALMQNDETCHVTSFFTARPESDCMYHRAISTHLTFYCVCKHVTTRTSLLVDLPIYTYPSVYLCIYMFLSPGASSTHLPISLSICLNPCVPTLVCVEREGLYGIQTHACAHGHLCLCVCLWLTSVRVCIYLEWHNCM